MRVAVGHALALCTTMVAALAIAPSVDPIISVGAFAPLVGIASGAVLFCSLSRRSIPYDGLRRAPKRRLLARSLVLSLKSAQEEAVWRGVVLGVIVGTAGRAGALVLSTAAFAAAHLSSHGRLALVHVLTGAVFGAAYVVTGDLTAAISAHIAYNVLIGAGLLAEQTLSVSAKSATGMAAIGSRLPRNGSLHLRDSDVVTEGETPVARLRAVRKAFRAVVAVDGVDLELRRGEILALLGPNGAGKSTAVAIMLGLRRPDSGQATLFGGDPRDARSRRHVGAVLQDVSFPSGLRVKAVVDLVRAHYPDARPTAEVLAQIGLDGAAERDAGGLSGGQRRRLAVAMALAGSPRALFLDEPTAGMDASARRALLGDIVSFAADGGAVLLTTQQLREAEEIASRVVLLSQGRVVLEGTVAEVRARGGRARVTLRTQRLPVLAGIVSTESRGNRHIVYVDDADRFVTDLVRSGVTFQELEVTRPSLEDAFVTLLEKGAT